MFSVWVLPDAEDLVSLSDSRDEGRIEGQCDDHESLSLRNCILCLQRNLSDTGYPGSSLWSCMSVYVLRWGATMMTMQKQWTKIHTRYLYQALCNTLFWRLDIRSCLYSLDSMTHGNLLHKVCQEKNGLKIADLIEEYQCQCPTQLNWCCCLIMCFANISFFSCCNSILKTRDLAANRHIRGSQHSAAVLPNIPGERSPGIAQDENFLVDAR